MFGTGLLTQLAMSKFQPAVGTEPLGIPAGWSPPNFHDGFSAVCLVIFHWKVMGDG